MAKIGRNDQCPCGSGMKYKKCCLPKIPANQTVQLQPRKVSITEEVVKLQESAVTKKETLKAMGVFIFFSTKEGDAWLLELTGMDAVQVAKAGQKIEVEITELDATIEVNWSHQFAIKDKLFTTTAYADKAVMVHNNYPTASISAASRKIRSRFSSEILNQIHVDAN